MNIAIIGYGKMGHAVEREAVERGHRIVCTIDTPEEWNEKAHLAATADVAIEFTTPATAPQNIIRCFENGLPVVCGTTGWYSEYPNVADKCRQLDGTLFTATNFSIGMNILFAVNKQLAHLMCNHPEYSVDITETHHIHKLDAPSGTAITLQQQITENGKRESENVPITSIREGEVPGIHTIRYNSEIDTITISHEAHSRKGLAVGAVLAAEFVKGKKGIFSMDDMLGLK